VSSLKALHKVGRAELARRQRSASQWGGGALLLRTLRHNGLADEALPVAAALVAELDHAALVRAELGRRDEMSVYAPSPVARTINRSAPGREFDCAADRLRVTTNSQEPLMPATTTATTDAPAADAPAVRQPKDAKAAELATAARDLARAAGLKSAYTSGEGREVLDRFTVERARGALVIAKDSGEPVRVKLTVLRAFVAGEKDDDTRAAAKVMAELARDLKGMLYGRKLACFLIARAA
jgi:hypothetical protein